MEDDVVLDEEYDEQEDVEIEDVDNTLETKENYSDESETEGWCRLSDLQLSQSHVVIPKYYEAIRQLKDYTLRFETQNHVIEDGTDTKTTTLEQSLKTVGYFSPDKDDNKEFVNNCINICHDIIEFTSSHSELYDKQQIILKRIYQAIHRNYVLFNIRQETNKKDVTVTNSKSDKSTVSLKNNDSPSTRNRINNKGKTNSFIGTLISKKTNNFLEINKKFLSSHVTQQIPLSLLNESSDIVDKFENKINNFISSKGKTQLECKLIGITSLLVLSLSVGNLNKLLNVILLLLQDHFELQQNSKLVTLPVYTYLSRLDKYCNFNSFNVLLPSQYINSIPLLLNNLITTNEYNYFNNSNNSNNNNNGSLCTDGYYYYIFNSIGLFKIGTGHFNTVQGYIYNKIINYRNKDIKVDIAVINNLLLYTSQSQIGIIYLINKHSFTEVQCVDIIDIIKSTNSGITITKVRITSNGNELIVIYETTQSIEEKQIFNYMFAKLQLLQVNGIYSFTISTTKEITYNSNDESNNNNNSKSNYYCCCCSRINFKVKKYKCVECGDKIIYCATCYNSGYLPNTNFYKNHSQQHVLQLVDDNTTTTNNNSNNNITNITTTPANVNNNNNNSNQVITTESISNCKLYCTNEQLFIVIAPLQGNNKFNNYITKIISLEDGLFQCDINNHYNYLGNSIYFDSLNHLLISYDLNNSNNSNDINNNNNNNHFIHVYQCMGNYSLNKIKQEQNDYQCSETMSAKYNISNVTNNSVMVEVVIVELLKTIEYNLRRVQYKAGLSNNKMNYMNNIVVNQYFAIEYSTNFYVILFNLLNWCSINYFQSTTQPLSPVIGYSIVTSLRLLHANLQYSYNYLGNFCLINKIILILLHYRC